MELLQSLECQCELTQQPPKLPAEDDLKKQFHPKLL